MSDEMTALLVHGLNGEGPGDIVGAFTNEANVDPDAIGTIEIEAREATVDVRSSVVDRIVQALDGGRIGTASVSITQLDSETEAEAGRQSGSIRSLLRTQYRMHRSIMNFSSRQFYDDKLEADESVRHHTLDDLGGTWETLPADRRETLAPNAPLLFVDTTQIDAPERQRSGSHSRENPREAALLGQWTTDLRGPRADRDHRPIRRSGGSLGAPDQGREGRR